MSKLKYKDSNGVWQPIAPSQKEFDDFQTSTVEQLADIMSYSIYNGLNVKVPLGTNLTPCKSDGLTDDTQALQAAIDYISSIGGGIVFLPPAGNYLIGKINIPSNVRLIGNNTVIKGKDNVIHGYFSLGSRAEHILISGFEFNEAVTPNDAENFIAFNGNNNVQIESCVFGSCARSAIVYNEKALNQNINIHDCTFNSTGHCGIQLKPVKNISIYNNKFYNVIGYSTTEPAHAIYLRGDGEGVADCLEDVFIYDNYIESTLTALTATHAFKLSILQSLATDPNYRSKNINVYHNTVKNPNGGVIADYSNDLNIYDNAFNCSVGNIYLTACTTDIVNNILEGSGFTMTGTNNNLTFKGNKLTSTTDKLINIPAGTSGGDITITHNILTEDSCPSDANLINGNFNNVTIAHNTMRATYRALYVLGNITIVKIIGNNLIANTKGVGRGIKNTAISTYTFQAQNVIMNFEPTSGGETVNDLVFK